MNKIFIVLFLLSMTSDALGGVVRSKEYLPTNCTKKEESNDDYDNYVDMIDNIDEYYNDGSRVKSNLANSIYSDFVDRVIEMLTRKNLCYLNEDEFYDI